MIPFNTFFSGVIPVLPTAGVLSYLQAGDLAALRLVGSSNERMSSWYVYDRELKRRWDTQLKSSQRRGSQAAFPPSSDDHGIDP